MHKFLRSIGFSNIKTREQMQKLIEKTIRCASKSSFVICEDDCLIGDYSLDFGPGIGLTVCGEFDEKDDFYPDFCFPYLKTENVSTCECSAIDRHTATVSYAGIVEDNRIGISIIYYLKNRIEYIKKSFEEIETVKAAPVAFTGLSDSGMIMMPIAKTEFAKKKMSHSTQKHDKLIEAARQGNEEAIESLTLSDIDVYSTISRKIKEEDLYSIVDTYFMPYGAESDSYAVLGEIRKVEEIVNSLTNESVYRMDIICNGMPISICINKIDLFGEPEVGRRFKGNIWLQGDLIIAGSHS